MSNQPHAEHAWLNDLIGNWEFSHLCDMGPGQPPTTATGRVTVRTLGGLWFLMDGSGTDPEGGSWTWLCTLGFDPERKRYVGTFVASMMTHLWIYEGKLDDSGKSLVLDVEGPRFDGTGMTKYQDIYEIVDHDHWILRSRILGDDGAWHQFMEGHHRRVP